MSEANKRKLIAEHKRRLKNKIHESYDLEKDIRQSALGISSFTSYVLDYLEFEKDFNTPTLGVGYNKSTKKLRLIYNPIFMCQLDDKQKYVVLTHEAYHICLEHLTTLSDYAGNPDDPQEQRLINIAGDLVINGQEEIFYKIKNFYWVTEDNEIARPIIPGADQFKGYSRKQTFEYYYNNIKRQFQKNNSLDKAQSNANMSPYKVKTLDEHDWADIETTDIESDEDAKEVSNIVGKIIEDAADHMSNRSIGKLPMDLRKKIELEKAKKAIDPKQVLNMFVKKTLLSEKKSTLTKLNRRKPYLARGRKKDKKPNLVVFIDHSGSINNKMLASFNDWLDKVVKLVDITLVPFDTEVKEKEVVNYKKGQTTNKLRFSFGGTDFQPPVDWANERRFDGVIFLTDLMARIPSHSKQSRIWVTDNRNYQAHSGYFKNKGEKVVNLGVF